MTEKMLDTEMTRSSSHLASIYGKDFLELVWENGQVLVRGGSSNRTRNTPVCIGYSVNPSHDQEAIDEHASITKRARLNTSYSLLDHFPAQKDSDLCSSHHQSKNSFKPNEEFTNLRPLKDSNLTHHPFTTTANGLLCSYSSQQCSPSAPLKKPRTDSSQTPTTTNSQKQYLGCDQRSGKVNFSNFVIPAVFLKSTNQGNTATQKTGNASSTRVEEIESKAVVTSTSSKAPDHFAEIESAKGSHSGLKGFQEQTSLTANKSNPASLAERSVEPPLDEHSEAIGHDSALGNHGSHGQNHNQTSNSAALGAKGKANTTNLCDEQASSSVCSLGASNNPNFSFGKNEDTEDSTYLSDNDEEPEDIVKEMPAREDNRVKRNRNAEIHNFSERKRRDKINKKMRTLKELIPNCNKIDKASMLDDAITYLKALKLQLQIMSMASGLCMPLMMSPVAAHLTQLMGAGMGFVPGTGTGIPCNPPQFPINIPHLSSVTNNRLHQTFGFTNQIIPPMPMPNAPFVPIIGNSSTQPLSTATRLANSATNIDASVSNNSDPYAKAEKATKQAWIPSPQH